MTVAPPPFDWDWDGDTGDMVGVGGFEVMPELVHVAYTSTVARRLGHIVTVNPGECGRARRHRPL